MGLNFAIKPLLIPHAEMGTSDHGTRRDLTFQSQVKIATWSSYALYFKCPTFRVKFCINPLVMPYPFNPVYWVTLIGA